MTSVLENKMTLEMVSNQLLKFVKQVNKHTIKFSDIFSALFSLQKKMISLEKKLESTITQQNNKDKELEELKNDIKYIKSEMNLQQNSEVLVMKNTLELDLIKKPSEIQINVKNLMKHQENEVKDIEDTIDTKELSLFNHYDVNPDISSKWLESDTQLHKQHLEIRSTMTSKEHGRPDDENKKAILILKQDLLNCKASIFQQREILKALECKYNIMINNEFKNKIVNIEKENDCRFDEIHQTIQELKIHQKNVEEILINKIEKIQELVNIKIKEGEHLILSNVCESNQKMQNNFKSFESDLHTRFSILEDHVNTSEIINKIEDLEEKLSKSHKSIDDAKEMMLQLQNFDMSVELKKSHDFTDLKNQQETISKLLERLQVEHKQWIDESKSLLQCQEHIMRFEVSFLANQLLSQIKMTPRIKTYEIKQMTKIKELFQVDIKASNLFVSHINISSNINPIKICFFLFYKIISVVLDAEFKDNCLLLLERLLSHSNFNKIVGKSEFIFVVMQYLEYCSNFPLSYPLIKYIWRIIITLTFKEPDNCLCLMKYGYINYFITYHNLFSYDKECLDYMFNTISNIAEEKTARKEMMNSTFIFILLEKCNLKNSCLHDVIELIGLLLSDGPDAWTVHNPSRKIVLQKIENVIDDYSPTTFCNVIYNSLEPLFHLITHDSTYQVQLCGAWLLANVVYSNPEMYYPQIAKLDGFNTLHLITNKTTTNNKVKVLINSIIKIYRKVNKDC